MNQLPYMPLYWNDLLSDNKVRVMSNEELGAYVRLLGAAWQEDIPGTLPVDDDVLARLAGAELSLWRKLSRRILPCFALNEQSGRYEQKRMMAEHAKIVAQIEMKHARAAGAAKRWGEKPTESPPGAPAMLKHNGSNANQSQSQSQTPETAAVAASAQGKPVFEPPSLETVKSAAAASGIPAEVAEAYWNDRMKTDPPFTFATGQPVGSYHHDMAAYWQRWQSNASKQKPNGNHHPKTANVHAESARAEKRDREFAEPVRPPKLISLD